VRSGALGGKSALGVGGCGRDIYLICFFYFSCQSLQRRDALVAVEEQHRRFAAGQSKYYGLYVNSGKLILAAM
jgi:hypothetical protein